MKTHLSACTKTSQPDGDTSLFEQSNPFSESDRTYVDQMDLSVVLILSCLTWMEGYVGRHWNLLELFKLMIKSRFVMQFERPTNQTNILDAVIVL